MYVFSLQASSFFTDTSHSAAEAQLCSLPQSFAQTLTPSFLHATLSRQTNDANIHSIVEENDVFTVYIKDLGPWTKALKNTALGAETTGNGSSLLVDVDGFYSQVQSLNSMKVAAGAPRVVIVAGGSGMTSLIGFIQVGLLSGLVFVGPGWLFKSGFGLVGETLVVVLGLRLGVNSLGGTCSRICAFVLQDTKRNLDIVNRKNGENTDCIVQRSQCS